MYFKEWNSNNSFPDKNGEYLCILDEGNGKEQYKILYFENNEWNINNIGIINKKVIAWMEFPYFPLNSFKKLDKYKNSLEIQMFNFIKTLENELEKIKNFTTLKEKQDTYKYQLLRGEIVNFPGQIANIHSMIQQLTENVNMLMKKNDTTL